MFKKTGIGGQFENRPELPALHQLLSKALENRGRQMQLIWRAHGQITFTLILVYHLRTDPRWCLYSEQGGKRQLVFDYSSCDVLLVMNLISSSCAELQKSGRSPFLANNRSLSTAPEPAAPGPNAEQFSPAANAPEQLTAETFQTAQSSRWDDRDTAHQSAAEAFAAAKETKVASTPDASQPFANAIDYGPPQSAVSFNAGSESAPDSATKRLISKAADKVKHSHEESQPNAEQVPLASSDASLILKPRPIDAAAIQSVMVSLRRRDTGMFMYPVFLYFLEQEYFRSLRSRSSLSVILCEIRETTIVDGETVRKVLPTPALVDAVMRISELKRHVDVLAHYDAHDCAILLPNTRGTGARTFAERLFESFTNAPLGGLEPSQLSIAFGSASIPEDFVELSKLLGAADLALAQARQSGAALVMYRDIKDSVKVPE